MAVFCFMVKYDFSKYEGCFAMKKSLTTGLLFFSTLLPLTAQAGLVSAVDGVELLAVNGKAMEHFGAKADKQVDLPAGKYQIAVRYENEVRRTGTKNMLYTSSMYVMNLDVGKDALSISIPNMRYESQANAFFRDPTWTVTNLAQNREFEVKGDRISASGFMTAENVESALARYNESNNVAFVIPQIQTNAPTVAPVPSASTVTVPTTASTATVIPVVTPAVKSVPNQAVLTQLQTLYKTATPEEKKAFRRWIIDHE